MPTVREQHALNRYLKMVGGALPRDLDFGMRVLGMQPEQLFTDFLAARDHGTAALRGTQHDIKNPHLVYKGAELSFLDCVDETNTHEVDRSKDRVTQNLLEINSHLTWLQFRGKGGCLRAADHRPFHCFREPGGKPGLQDGAGARY
jgi:hypothetical protein